MLTATRNSYFRHPKPISPCRCSVYTNEPSRFAYRLSSLNLLFTPMAASITASQKLSMPPIKTPENSCKVAVIGAGAAGLVAARELRKEGHKVVVFEQSDRIGGTWVYNPNVESDLLGLDSSRTIVHSSLYESLRTNLPREVMGFRDYPFVAKDGRDRDSRRFPGHREVLHYLEDFARDFKLTELVRFETQVFHVGLVEEGKWVVRYRKKHQNDKEHVRIDEDEFYDSIVVCNGHFTEPRIAEIPGIDSWPGKQMHSHNYRVPDPFQEKVVVLIGSSASAVDISRDIAEVAKEVHIATRSFGDGATKQPGYNNMWLHCMVKGALEDGTVVFQDGTSIFADVVLHCTGYKYHFPFLKTNNIVTVDDNCVGPLYKHIFPPVLAPSLSFIGLPWKVIPFPMLELQVKWVAGVLSGSILLPSQEEMMGDVEAFYSKLESAGIPKRYAHNMSDYQFEYNDWLAAECGCPASEEWRKEMYYSTGKNRVSRPNTYRDEWEDQDLVSEAQTDFVQYLSCYNRCEVEHKQSLPAETPPKV